MRRNEPAPVPFLSTLYGRPQTNARVAPQARITDQAGEDRNAGNLAAFRFQFRRRYLPRLPAYAPVGAAFGRNRRGSRRLRAARSNRLSEETGMPARPRLRKRPASSARCHLSVGEDSPAECACSRPFTRTFRTGRETMPAGDVERVLMGPVLIDRAPGPRTTPARPRSWCARTRRLNRRQSGGIRRGGTSRERSGTSAAPECPAPGGQRAGR
jgi:hypothetical protein